MLKIGEFATLADINVKTLRYYDDIGLLKPSFIDPETGYRFYDYAQLARVYRILAFREIGFTLHEIHELLDNGLSPGPMRRFLRTKRQELQTELITLQQQIAYLDNKIYEVEMDGRIAAYEVMLKRLEPMRILVASDKAPLKQDIGETIQRLLSKIKGYNLYPTAPMMAIFPVYLHPPGNIPLEVAQPTDSIVEIGEDDVEWRLFPAMTVAAVIHIGSADMASGWVALNEWIQRNGYRIIGPFREIFLYESPQGDSHKFTYELQFPIEKIRQGS